jgi:hypothetical protein
MWVAMVLCPLSQGKDARPSFIMGCLHPLKPGARPSGSRRVGFVLSLVRTVSLVAAGGTHEPLSHCCPVLRRPGHGTAHVGGPDPNARVDHSISPGAGHGLPLQYIPKDQRLPLAHHNGSFRAGPFVPEGWSELRAGSVAGHSLAELRAKRALLDEVRAAHRHMRLRLEATPTTTNPRNASHGRSSSSENRQTTATAFAPGGPECPAGVEKLLRIYSMSNVCQSARRATVGMEGEGRCARVRW